MATAVKNMEDLKARSGLGAKTIDPGRMKISVGMSTCGIAAGAAFIYDAFSKAAKDGVLKDAVVAQTGCVGFCQREPLVEVKIPGKAPVLYGDVTRKSVDKLIAALAGGTEIPEMIVGADSPFYKKQVKLALRNCGYINPDSIEEYMARGGYASVFKALKMKPDEIISVIEKSGLRGRGGGGFPTGRKWRSCRDVKAEPRYVVCNGDEGDPGAFMDRSVMEGDPHSVLEGMIIGAYAVGSNEGYIYVRDEYPLAVRNLKIAIGQAREAGFLGAGVAGSGFAFDVKIVRGGGAFVCGESSALMQSLEGKVGEPRAKYIRSVERGFKDKPTVLNNVETWANVPLIIDRGADWFAGMGTEKSKGTKVFALVGKVNNTGLVEVPMGITLREIVFDIGGGIPGGKKFKAVQTGGPSGGCIPDKFLDMGVDFDKLSEIGSMMGSGGMIVMDERTCMVDVARYFLEFLVTESCGKCVPCREGVKRLYEIVDRITHGKGQEGDIEHIQELGRAVQLGSLCGLGTSAPNPVLTTIQYFRDEYEAHIKDHRCPAGVCKDLISYSINEKCTGCLRCKKECPQQCISGELKKLHVIDKSKCIKCGVCVDVCNFDAVEVR
ncbi:MAG: NADH-ubiquinone oxidoreductase-F iron-sulfur binding region domain-containing protein [Myxococcota bacterium]|jgi:NADH:ubiquinone oxidoreductase subunit F (NADH-binding)